MYPNKNYVTLTQASLFTTNSNGIFEITRSIGGTIQDLSFVNNLTNENKRVWSNLTRDNLNDFNLQTWYHNNQLSCDNFTTTDSSSLKPALNGYANSLDIKTFLGDSNLILGVLGGCNNYASFYCIEQ